MTLSDALQRVPWLSALDADARAALLGPARVITFPARKTIVAELEPGDELYVILRGTARVTITPGRHEPIQIARLGPGDACGEISLLTHQLRSATVTSLEPVTALRFTHRDFDDLLARYPSIAVHFVRVIASRLAETREELFDMVQDHEPDASRPSRLAGHSPAVLGSRASVRRAWNEVITGRRGFSVLALGSFLVVLAGVRIVGWLVQRAQGDMFALLRVSYTVGFTLLMISAVASLLRFRASWQRMIAVVFGAALALVANGLSVFLAFDYFYLDMTTRDPNLVFDIDTLLKRTESLWAISLGASALILAGLLGRFWRRVAYAVRAYVRRDPDAASREAG